MESRSVRRFSGALGIEASSHFAMRPQGKSRNGIVSTRSCSFILLLQVCMALMCGNFLLQWWHWEPSPLVSRDALHATAKEGAGHLRGVDVHDKGTAPQPAVLERAVTNDGTAPAPAPLEQATPTTPAPSFPVKTNRVFIPPKSDVSAEEMAAWRERFNPAKHTPDQRKVAEMVAWAWKGYEDNAFGQDYLNVQTMKGDGLPGHDMAITLVDSLDTLFLTGMFEQFDRAAEWVGKNMHERIYQSGFISLFETTIRNMGGLLSAYYLSGQQQLLEAAKDLGEALSPAFRVYGHGIPGKDFDVMSKRARDSSSVAEAGSLQLEFKYLAMLTGERKYHDQVERIMDTLFQEVHEKFPNGLLPVQMSVYSGRIVNSKITLGAFGDSYYEYLLKQWLQSGKKDDKYRVEYLRAVKGIQDVLVMKSKPNGLTFIAEHVYGELSPKMDHLVCFVPGMLALGYIHGMPEEHLDLAKELIETCYQMYDQMAAKLAPEIAYFHVEDDAEEDLDIHPQDAFNIQRPETVESLMILYRVTKNEKYREYGRNIMNAFENHSKLPGGGYTTLGNVAKGPVRTKFRDGMESFFLAETLKYLFLLFSDDESLLPLDEIVFNTEAHPFPMKF